MEKRRKKTKKRKMKRKGKKRKERITNLIKERHEKGEKTKIYLVEYTNCL